MGSLSGNSGADHSTGQSDMPASKGFDWRDIFRSGAFSQSMGGVGQGLQGMSGQQQSGGGGPQIQIPQQPQLSPDLIRKMFYGGQ